MTSTYQRQHWQEWIGTKLLHIGYWPQYMEWQTEWVHFDPQHIVADLLAAGIEVLEWGVPENYPALTAGHHVRHPALETLGYDPYQRLIDECHRHDIKVMLWGPTNPTLEGNLPFWSQHRDVLAQQGVPTTGPLERNTNLCVHNPLFVKKHLELIHALASSYDVDGIAFDGPWPLFGLDHEKGTWQCDYCRRSFKTYANDDRTPTMDWNDPLWRKFIIWRQKSVADFLRAQRQAVKDVDDRILVCENSQVFPELCYRMPYADPNDIETCIDSPFNECVVNSYWQLAITTNVKLQRAAADGRITGIYHKTSDMPFLVLDYGLAQGRPDYVDAATTAYVSLANGAWVSFHASMDEKAQPHPARLQVSQQIARELKPKLPYFTNPKPYQHAAVCYHVKTRDFYAGARPEMWLRAFLGAERFLVESHLPSQYLLDRQLHSDYLKDYPLLVLPNTACMADAEISAVRDYVAQGGALLATAETSLYDENEQFRGNFGLADVFGINYTGINPARSDVTAGHQLAHGIMLFKDHPALADLTDLDCELGDIPWFSVTAAIDRHILATWAQLRPDTIHACVNLGREIIGDTNTPALVSGPYGKGKVIYVSTNLLAQYAVRTYPTTRRLLTALAQWLAPCPIRYQGPAAVECNIMHQPDHRRLVIHLVNYAVYGKAHGSLTYHPHCDENQVWRPFSLPPHRHTPRCDMPPEAAALALPYRQCELHPDILPCNEVIPIHDTHLLIDKTLTAGKRIYQAPDNIPLEIIDQGSNVRVNLPRIDIHQMIVVK